MKRATTIVVSEKGQVTIPKPLRDRLGIKAGESLEMFEEHGQLIARKVMSRDAVEQVYGVIALGAPTDAIVRQLRGDDPDEEPDRP